MTDPTTAEMIEFLESEERAAKDWSECIDRRIHNDEADAALEKAAMFRAIATRLRTNAGITHEPPAFEAAPGNVAMGNFGRKE